MSKIQNVPVMDYSGLFVNHFKLGNVEGKILTIVETMGLQKTQEEAVKSLVRQAIWDTIFDGRTPMVGPKTGERLVMEWEKEQKRSDKSVPNCQVEII